VDQVLSFRILRVKATCQVQAPVEAIKYYVESVAAETEKAYPRVNVEEVDRLESVLLNSVRIDRCIINLKLNEILAKLVGVRRNSHIDFVDALRLESTDFSYGLFVFTLN